jgi:hypothetical protein
MGKVICLYGGPGTGKSTTAAHIFALLKQGGINAELVSEYVKEWAWEGRHVLPGDQYYFLAKQSRRERIRFKDVDVMVTDSPVWLSAVYEQEHEPEPHVAQVLVDKHVAIAKEAGFEHKHVFLRRVKPYNPKGRWQTEGEAKDIDEKILEYLKRLNLSYIMCDADTEAAAKIIRHLGLI